MKQIFERRTAELQKVLNDTLSQTTDSICRAADVIVDAYKNGRGVFLFGNGGSAADAQHVAGELNGRFLKERSPLKAQSLVGDAATMSCIANDYGYDQMFARQLMANAGAGDVAFGFTTSGNSKNVIEAFKAARTAGVKTITMTGAGGGAIAEFSDVLIAVPSSFTPHVQETGVLIYHCLCEKIENALFGES